MEFAIWRLLFIVILVVVDVGTAVYYRYVENVDTKVGYAAHFAGAIAGLLVGVNVLRNLQVERWEKVVWWICFAIYVALMAAAIAINFLWVDHFPPPRYWSPKTSRKSTQLLSRKAAAFLLSFPIKYATNESVLSSSKRDSCL